MAVAGLLLGGGIWLSAWARLLPPLSVVAAPLVSTEVLDRHGQLLRGYAMSDGRWRFAAKVHDVDPRFIAMLQAYEDRRFREHGGVDPWAMARAAWQFTTNARVISGGSTLTMQVARLLEPRTDRTVAAKFRQIIRAVQLEHAHSKDEILGLYLTLAPYGGNLEGVRAASLAYFGKEPRRLTLAEAGLLVALPQSPEARRPDRSVTAAAAARDRVLHRIAQSGLIPIDEIELAKQQFVVAGRRRMPALAPHMADRVVAAQPEWLRHQLTIDATLQRNFEDLVLERARVLGPAISIAVLAIDHGSGQVLARVGSSDYFDERRAGQVDMTEALRSPGSALKPFIYGLAFEDGIAHPETLIEDRPVRFGAYAPENFDMTYQGTVTVRKALQLSLNVPAVQLLDGVGASRLSARIAQAGASLVLPKGEAPGLAMALGGLGIKLSDLTKLYAGVARGGEALPMSERQPQAQQPAQRLLDPVAAWYVAQSLLGTPPPENAAGGRIAFKTGTSYGYRDAWSVGFDGRRTIGVWVGRPDGAPVVGLTGRLAAAPILFEAFARLGEPLVALPPAPAGAVVTTSAKLPLPLRHVRTAGVLASEGMTSPLKIVFPPDNARLELTSASGRPDPLTLKITGGVEPLSVLVNGAPATTRAERRTLSVDPDGPGFFRLTVIDARGKVESVAVRLQ